MNGGVAGLVAGPPQRSIRVSSRRSPTSQPPVSPTALSHSLLDPQTTSSQVALSPVPTFFVGVRFCSTFNLAAQN